MKEKVRVVVDTNVVVSGIISRQGPPFKIINEWIQGRKFQPIICRELQEEINEVLRRFKMKNRPDYDLKDIQRFLAILFNKAERIKPKFMEKNPFLDSGDHFLLELAVSAGAKFIVSGDVGVLWCARYKGIEFLSPEEFCKCFSL